MSIEEILSCPEDSIGYALSDLTKNAEAEISTFGYRVITLKGVKGSIEIEKIAHKYIQTFEDIKKYTQSKEELIEHLKTWERIVELYEKADQKMLKTTFWKYFPKPRCWSNADEFFKDPKTTKDLKELYEKYDDNVNTFS